MNEDAEVAFRWGGIQGTLFEKCFESGNNLFKSLLIHRLMGFRRIERNFVDAFSKQPGFFPSSQSIGYFQNEVLPLGKCQMDIGFCLLIVFLGLRQQFRFLFCESLNVDDPLSEDFPSSLFVIQGIEVLDPGLLKIRS